MSLTHPKLSKWLFWTLQFFFTRITHSRRLAAALGVFLHPVPESKSRDSVLRFSRTRGSGFLVRGACEDRMHDWRSIRAVRTDHSATLRAIHAPTRIAGCDPTHQPPRIRRFVHGAGIIYLIKSFDKIWKPSRVCTVSLGRKKSQKLKPLAFDE